MIELHLNKNFEIDFRVGQFRILVVASTTG